MALSSALFAAKHPVSTLLIKIVLTDRIIFKVGTFVEKTESRLKKIESYFMSFACSR